MKSIVMVDDGITAGDLRIPYGGFIKVSSNKEKSEHIILFNIDGEDRALLLKLSPGAYLDLRGKCLAVNPACYFQTYQAGQALAMSVVLLSTATVLSLVGAMVCFKKQAATGGWVLIVTALLSMIAGTIVNMLFSGMKRNNGDSPEKLKKARKANECFRNR
ncbi:MAG: hypothetical protein VB051_09065 [Candidatus Pelethousia sp.]|nr:hypothetical protein [Candidatus Pelethousia sp.]